MKRTILSVAILFCATATTFAQKHDDDVKPNVVKVNPLGLLFGQGNIAFEHAIGENNSILVAPSFGFFKFGGFKYTSAGLGAEYRFYLSSNKTAPSGFYAAPGVGFGTGKIKEDGSSDKAKFNSFILKGIIGNQWIFGSGFVVDLNGGIQYSSFKYKDNTSSTFNGLKGSGILPSITVAIGYNF